MFAPGSAGNLASQIDEAQGSLDLHVAQEHLVLGAETSLPEKLHADVVGRRASFRRGARQHDLVHRAVQGLVIFRMPLLHVGYNVIDEVVEPCVGVPIATRGLLSSLSSEGDALHAHVAVNGGACHIDAQAHVR